MATDQRWNCRGDRLIDTVRSMPSSSCSALPSQHAVINAHSPIGTINPVSSASAINCEGETHPSFGCVQRNNASIPVTTPVVSEICGW